MELEQVRKVLAWAPPGFFGANVYDEQQIAAAIMRVQLAKLPRIAGALAESRRALEAGTRATVACEPRKVVDPAGDLAFEEMAGR